MDNTQRKQSTRNSIAILISDIHYNIQTLKVADKALRTAITVANEMNLQLIICGDTHDGKANIRGECVKALMDTISLCNKKPIIIIANHDRINEKNKEHSLEFLRDLAILITEPKHIDPYGYILPYYHDTNELKEYLKQVPSGSRILMHQGVMGSEAGHYIQDKSACPTEWFADYRVISGHYHKKQDIKCGRPRKGHIGLFTYLGNPYTLNFGEANDPAKGYHILNDDGSLELIPLDLPRHIIVEFNVKDFDSNENGTADAGKNDFVWVKLTGTQDDLSKINRNKIKEYFNLNEFKLDLIPLATKSTLNQENVEKLAQPELLDTLIDSLTNIDDKQKKRLKSTWKDFT